MPKPNPILDAFERKLRAEFSEKLANEEFNHKKKD